MHLWCTDDALMMRWLFTDDVLLVPWWCPDDAMMMHQWCTHDALMMHWWCTDDALSKIWCTGYDMMHIGQVFDLHGRFYGGRINGNKMWRPTDRQGEYRAICLWKMDWQSFAKIALIFMIWLLSICSPFVWEINHFGDGHIDGLATLKLRRHRTESERDLSQLLFSYFPDNNTFSPFFGQKSFKLFLFWSLKSWRESSETWVSNNCGKLGQTTARRREYKKGKSCLCKEKDTLKVQLTKRQSYRWRQRQRQDPETNTARRQE